MEFLDVFWESQGAEKIEKPGELSTMKHEVVCLKVVKKRGVKYSSLKKNMFVKK